MADPERDRTAPRPVGRPESLGVKMTTIMLEPAMIEWGRQQDGGLSATVRRLLREAMGNAAE